MQLYEIPDIYNDLAELYAEATSQGELDSILEQIESVEVEFSEKAETYAKIITDAKADAKKYKEEIDRLRGLEFLATDRADRLKAKLKEAMEAMDIKKSEVGIFKLSIQNNGGNPAVEIAETIVDEKGWIKEGVELPEEILTFVPKVESHFIINLQGIYDLKKEGKDLPDGIKATRGTQLRIE